MTDYKFGDVLVRFKGGDTWEWCIDAPGTLGGGEGSINCYKNKALYAAQSFWEMGQDEINRRYNTKIKTGYTPL